MRLIFATGDVGGARAMAPVINLAAAQGHICYALKNSALATDHLDLNVPWTWIEPTSSAAQFILEHSPDALCFATSINDNLALKWAETAQQLDCPTLHLLDHWTNYSSRLMTPDGKLHAPNIYAVMDDLAMFKVKEIGLPGTSIEITGTPAMSHVVATQRRHGGPLIFASEPVTMDQGKDNTNPGFRGYTEHQVLKTILTSMQPFAHKVTLEIFAHPREDQDDIRRCMQENRGAVKAKIVNAADKPSALANARGVIGMASILLYEAWLSRIPVLSFQPGLLLENLRYLHNRPGLICLEETHGLEKGIEDLLQSPDAVSHYCRANSELQRHHDAANRVLLSLQKYVLSLQ